MPGYPLTSGSRVACFHQAPATPGSTLSRVRLGGEPAVAQDTPYTISGCGNPLSAGGTCVTGAFTAGTVRVRSGGKSLAISGAASRCVAPGTPMAVTTTQTRVRAT